MVIIMLVTLFIVSVSGFKIYAIEEGMGPLAGDIPELAIIRNAYADDDKKENEGEGFWEEFWEEIHEASANFMLILILLHVTGVYVSGRLHKENPAKAMFTGKRKLMLGKIRSE